MAKLVKLDVRDFPEALVVGKAIRSKMGTKENPIPAFWDKCFGDGTFAELEKHGEFVIDPDYVGWMADWEDSDGFFTYICGMLMKPGFKAPEGFISRKIAPCKAAVGWIKGASTADVCMNAHEITNVEMKKLGHSTDMDAGWCMELYNCPRFTTPGEDGEIILDYYIPVK